MRLVPETFGARIHVPDLRELLRQRFTGLVARRSDRVKLEVSEMKFMVGQVTHHRLFDYRGAVVEAHPAFQLTTEWYDKVARTRPPKDKPWYRVLVHGTRDVTYVAERNLEEDRSGEAIAHPLLGQFFDSFRDGYYSRGPRVS